VPRLVARSSNAAEGLFPLLPKSKASASVPLPFGSIATPFPQLDQDKASDMAGKKSRSFWTG